jgi:hypothetical protein
MADEPLPEYLDRMIYTLYGFTQRGIGYVPKNPLHSEMVEYIEDEKTGRPVPIEDNADHFLLRAFDRLRTEYRTRPLPEKGFSFRGSVVYANGCLGESDMTYGEIPWRNKHVEICNTCGEDTATQSFRASICSAGGHLVTLTRTMSDQPGVVRTISRTIPLGIKDEE